MTPTTLIGDSPLETLSNGVGSSPVELLNDARTSVDYRRYKREPMAIKAVISARSRNLGEVVELSETGLSFKLDSAATLKVGQKVKVKMAFIPGREKSRVTLRGTIRYHNPVSHQYGVWLDGLLSEQLQAAKVRPRKFIAAMGVLLLATIIGYLKSRNVVSFWYGPVIQTYSIGAALFVITRVIFSLFYKEPKDNGILPSVSLIVAVKNEEAHIAETVMHCLSSRYPGDKLEVMVVDDGSDDNTWNVLQKLQAEQPRLRCFQFAQNRGKRHAMALGTREAKGEILIFIDSDTFLEQEAIYRLVQPFADPKVGAVAGHTNVIVEENNPISKMEAVRYFVSQRIMKASESIFNAVTCCPGPLSGYRKAMVLPILDHWENQMFLGAKATFGDDRSLTNYILRNYRVVYHAGARCATYVPNKLSILIRQQLRWKKSWLRELTVAGRFMWTKHPVAAISYYTAMMITLVSPFIAFGALFGLPLIGVPFNMFGYLGGLLLAYALLGMIYYYHTQADHWYYGLYFALLYVCIFSFQNYYALLTVRKNQWGTR